MPALAVWALVHVSAPAQAATLGYRNDTQSVVVIQSAIVVNNQVRWGKPHTLFPGEAAQDAVPAPGMRVIAVFDPKQNNRLIYQETVTIGTADVLLSLRMIPPPAPRGQPQPPPQPRFIAIPLPSVGQKPGSPGAAKPPTPSPAPKAPGNPPSSPSKPPGSSG
jgi:hypothetical protein